MITQGGLDQARIDFADNAENCSPGSLGQKRAEAGLAAVRVVQQLIEALDTPGSLFDADDVRELLSDEGIEVYE